jgi:hypothetical protein
MRLLLGPVDVEIPAEKNVGIGVEVETRDGGKLDAPGSVEPKTRRTSNEILDPAARKLVRLFFVGLEGASVSGHVVS